ncbi:2-dehydropantoate 2-reductase [Chelatococcus sp. YT9]|uniref:ketopantoate reductase family protein n=1 Tax=Chelatococcus sp. YT9 TaxID=2835635 RepID=UPI001BCDBA04|nr:2-dehydropantoate 2-reductase [Chelatococcus sp. YT9]MBS7699054.1 2-dehydropantoate 2-reductase [Chelatococcus sp. YT9]
MTRLCIFGAGAVGSHLAAKLIRSGNADVSLVARGAHLAALRDNGLTLRGVGKSFTVPVATATDDPDSLPPQDVVVVGLKSHSLPPVAAQLGRLIAPDGVALFCLNGIPWWWNHGLPGKAGPLPLIDPDGVLWKEVGAKRALGVIVQSPNEIVAPGVVENASDSNHFLLGEPDCNTSPRLDASLALLQSAGIDAMRSPNIRRDVWAKLLRNASNGPLAALTRLVGAERNAFPELGAVGQAIITELVAIAGAQGYDMGTEVGTEAAERGKGPRAQALAAVRPSMLQDLLQGRPMEVESQLGQPALFADEVGVAAPTLKTVLALLRGLNHAITRGASPKADA